MSWSARSQVCARTPDGHVAPSIATDRLVFGYGRLALLSQARARLTVVRALVAGGSRASVLSNHAHHHAAVAPTSGLPFRLEASVPRPRVCSYMEAERTPPSSSRYSPGTEWVATIRRSRTTRSAPPAADSTSMSAAGRPGCNRRKRAGSGGTRRRIRSGDWVIRTQERPSPLPTPSISRRSNAAPDTRYATSNSAASALRFYSKQYALPVPSYRSRHTDVTAIGAYRTRLPRRLEHRLVPHETAHQWFYSVVATTSTRPLLSEGLATWAQTGPEHSLPTMLNTSIPTSVRDRIGEPMSFCLASTSKHAVGSTSRRSHHSETPLGELRLARIRHPQRLPHHRPRDLLTALQPSRTPNETRTRGAHF